MRILIISLNYLPESTSIGPYTADLAEYLQAGGHQVQVIAGFPIAPQWRVWDGYRGYWFMHEIINNVPILRTFLFEPSRPKKAFQRILFDLSFSLSSLIGGMSTGPADLIVVVSPPLQLGLTGWLLGLLKGAPFFIHIKDLVPDAAIATGMLAEGGTAVRIAHTLESFVYRRSRGIGVICDGFARNLIKKGVTPEKVVVLPDYIDLDFMHPLERNNGFRQQYGIKPDDWLVMYSGSVALKQGLHTYVEAAAEIDPADGVVFYLIGEGPYLEELTEKARVLNLPHFHFLPLQPREILPAQLGAADVLVITQRRAVTDIVFPGKLLYYMAAGRPILAAVSADSETGRFIYQNRVGLVVPPENPQALAEAVRFLRDNCQEAEKLGMNGRKIAERKFNYPVVLKRFMEHLESLTRPDK